jgi:hypothetical protein
VNPTSLGQNLVVLAQSLKFADELEEVGQPSATRMERNQKLIEEFGSHKRKRAMDKAELGRVSSENMVGREAVSELLSLQFEEYRKEDMVVDRLLPPHNVLAATPGEAYPLDGLIAHTERDALSSHVLKQQLAAAGGGGDEVWGLFASPLLRAWAGAVEPPLESVRAALFAGLLLRFYHGPRYFETHELGELLLGLDKLAQSFVERFAEPNSASSGGGGAALGFAKTERTKHRVVLALLVACLSLLDYVLDVQALERLAKDLKVEVDKLAPYLLQIGCKAKGSGSKRIWQLVVPLQFPDEKKPSGAAKRRR